RWNLLGKIELISAPEIDAGRLVYSRGGHRSPARSFLGCKVQLGSVSCGNVVLVASSFALDMVSSLKSANTRQKNTERRHIAASAAHCAACDAPLVFLYDALAYPQAQT